MLVLRLYSYSGLRFYLLFPYLLLTVKTVDRIQQVCLRITSCSRQMLAVVQLGHTASCLQARSKVLFLWLRPTGCSRCLFLLSRDADDAVMSYLKAFQDESS